MALYPTKHVSEISENSNCLMGTHFLDDDNEELLFAEWLTKQKV